MKIKKCTKGISGDVFTIIPEDHDFIILYLDNKYIVCGKKEYDLTEELKLSDVPIPEKVKQDLEDPLFELKCLKHMALSKPTLDNIFTY